MITASWVLAMMLALQPSAPWRSTYDRTAEAIAEAADRMPLEGGAEHTARVLVSLAWFESAFRPDAEGDCTKEGRSVACTVAGAVPHSFCLLQLHETNHRALGVTRAELLADVKACVVAGLRLVRDSLRICRSVPPLERLRWYAGGGPVCTTGEDAGRKSRHRLERAEWLRTHVPAP